MDCESEQKVSVSRRLKSVITELRPLQKLLVNEKVDPRVLTDFRGGERPVVHGRLVEAARDGANQREARGHQLFQPPTIARDATYPEVL